MTLDIILEEIKKANTIVILTHESPDGDAIGSSLAMEKALRDMGKEPDVIIKEYPRIFNFLPNANKVKEETDVEKYDLAISLDCADLKRLVGKEYFEEAKKTIVIDHHGSNTMYGDINFVNPVAPACCEILIGMFTYFNIDINIELGSCILTGIITDTGGFQWGGVTPETFEFAAELVRNGAKLKEICRIALRKKSKVHCELEKLIYDRMEFFEDGKIAIAYLTLEDYNNLNAEIGDDEGLVEMLRDIEGVEIAILLKEKEGANGFKASLRSHETINVSDICMLLGGGGHRGAAGCFVSGALDQAEKKVINAVKQGLKN